MNSNDHQRLYRLLEFKVLNAKRRKLVAAHILEGVSLASACRMIGLNVGRESRREDVLACLEAYKRAQDPDGSAQLEETARRLEILWYGRKAPADEQFATVNLPLSIPGTFITPDGKAVDATGKLIDYPEWPSVLARANSAWKCECRPEIAQPAGGYLCSFCGRDNPDTRANQQRQKAALAAR
jgi:hypothetical protein